MYTLTRHATQSVSAYRLAVGSVIFALCSFNDDFFCNLSHGSVPRCADLKMSIPGPRVNCQSTLLYNMSNAEDAQKSPYEFFRRVASHVNSGPLRP